MNEVARLDNGLRVVSSHMPDTQSVTVAFFVGSGARYEDMKTEYGVAHFIEHLLFKGTVKRPSPKKIVEMIDGVGGLMNAYTAEDHTCFYIKLPSKHFSLAMDVLSDTLANSIFEPTEIERERGVIMEEMRVYEDDPARFVFDLVGPMLWPNDTLRSNIIGTEQTISEMRREVIINYFKDLYCVSNMVLAVAGNVKHDEVLAEVNKFILPDSRTTNRHYEPASRTTTNHNISILRRPTNQAHLVVAGRAPELDSQDEISMRLVSTILGDGMSSRLFMNVREKRGLAYHIYMNASRFVDTGKFEIYAGVTHDKMTEALTAIKEELNNICSHLVSGAELHKAREQLRGRMIMGLESNSAVADWLGTQMILQNKITTLPETIKKIEAIREEDILLTSRKYLQPTALKLALIGDFDESQEDEFAKILES